MKPKLLSIIPAVAFFFFTFPASAQNETASQPPSWISNAGYWVVESNRQQPKEAVVYYYTNAHVLVYKEEIKNKKLKLTNPATLLRLKQSLEVAVASYANGRRAAGEQGLSLQR
ncbi:MAG TPA: hypothetical protein VGN63_15635 [Flavisolibacter sp.]|jgi:hypothetical protein|nr:hypothetical protein [Flavisolibacter sp.]